MLDTGKLIDYKTANTVLMNEYETRTRNWLEKSGDKGLAEKIPFLEMVMFPRRTGLERITHFGHGV